MTTSRCAYRKLYENREMSTFPGLVGGRFILDGERLGAGPGVLGDVEQHALGAVHLDLEAADPLGVALVHVVLAALRLDPPRRAVDVLHQDAKMVQSGVIHPPADLI